MEIEKSIFIIQVMCAQGRITDHTTKEIKKIKITYEIHRNFSYFYNIYI